MIKTLTKLFTICFILIVFACSTTKEPSSTQVSPAQAILSCQGYTGIIPSIGESLKETDAKCSHMFNNKMPDIILKKHTVMYMLFFTPLLGRTVEDSFVKSKIKDRALTLK